VAKTAEAFRNIGEVSEELGVKKHVLRFWEMKFPQLKPMKRGGGRRLYRPVDVELLRRIRDLLQTSGYTIKGVQKLLRERGVEHVVTAQDSHPSAPRQRTERRPAQAAAAATALQLSSLDVAALRTVVAELTACHALLAPSRDRRV
jgi:DNA-binding transcriptional MerR regulator